MTQPKAEDTASLATLNLNVPDITDHFDDIIEVALMTPIGDPYDADCIWGLPLIIWGLSGLGKSARIHGVARSMHLACGTILPGQHAPEDFSGIYLPDGTGKVKPFCTLPGVNRLIAAGEGVLFVDEAGGAAPATQGAMLGFINDRRAGDVDLPPGIRTLLAANPPEYSAGGWALEAPMANRLAHTKLNAPSAEDWSEWMLHRKNKPRPDLSNLKQRLLLNWPSAAGQTRALSTGFVKNRGKAFLHAQPLANHPQAGYNWPSPRTWDFATSASATSRALGKAPLIEELIVEACIGGAASNEYFEWVREMDLPDPSLVLVKGWKVRTDRLDITMAVVESCSSYVLDLPQASGTEKLDAAAGLWKLLHAVIDSSNPDLVVPAACSLSRAKLSRSDHNHQPLKSASEPVLLLLNKAGMLKYVPPELRL